MSSNSTTIERGQRRTWRCDEDDKLIQFLKEMYQDESWKAEGGFRAGYLIHLEKLFAEAMPDAGLKAIDIDSRLGYLKKRFNSLLEIKHKGSDFGWDEEQKMVGGDFEMFDEWAKSESKESPSHNSQSPEVTSGAIDGGTSTEKGDQGANGLEKALLVAVQDASPTTGNTSYGPVNQEAKTEGTAIKERSNGLEEDECVNGSVKLLTEKLSAALVNVSLKDDLVKQHTKVAEEAVIGWEKAENEVAVLNQQLEVVVQQKVAVEARVTHLDEALKECVRQLRLVKEEQESKISEVVAEKTHEWKVIKSNYESQVAELQAQLESRKAYSFASVCPELYHKLEYLEKENTSLKEKLLSQSEELQIRITERDLSTKAAETASKQHLESIKKMARLEAECRRLKACYCKPLSVSDRKSTAATSSCVESLSDSQSDNGEQLCVEVESHVENGLGSNEYELNHSDSWATALIAELDQFKSEKLAGRSLTSSSVEIDLMDDFLEMEQLAALPQNKRGSCVQTEAATGQSSNVESKLRNELVAMTHRTAELEKKIELMLAEMAELKMALIQSRKGLETSQVQLIEMEMKMENMEFELREATEMKQAFELRATGLVQETQKMSSQMDSLHVELTREKALSAEVSSLYKERELQRKKEELEQNAVSDYELKEKEMALNHSQDQLDKLQTQLEETETVMEQMQRELHDANEAKQQLESQLADARREAEALSAQVESLCPRMEKEQSLSSKLFAKCRDLEIELRRQEQVNQRQNTCSSNELKRKQADLAAAAEKLAECQKTIASLGTQLKSLATLEDFLIDTACIPGFSATALLDSKDESEPWRIHSNGTFSDKKENESLKNSHECLRSGTVCNGPESLASSSKLSASLEYSSPEESGLSFGKLFSLRRS